MKEDNGLLYMRARYYDQEIGRFINKDPIGYKGGLNLFAYVGNNPVNRIDPNGFSPGEPACWKAANDARVACGAELDKAVENAYKRQDWCQEAYEYCNLGNGFGADPIPKPTKKQCDKFEEIPSQSAAALACVKSPEMKAAIARSAKCAEAAIKLVAVCARPAGPVKKD
jgi:uncharacterized protein RhaS with RHS repeats